MGLDEIALAHWAQARNLTENEAFDIFMIADGDDDADLIYRFIAGMMKEGFAFAAALDIYQALSQ